MQDVLLNTALKVLRASFRLYNSMVMKASAQSGGNATRIPIPEVSARMYTISEIRLSLRKALVHFHAYSLSQKRQDWFPAILGMGILATSISIVLDVAFATPEPVRSTIWGSDIVGACKEIRERMYAIVLDLLRVKDDTDQPEGPRPLQLPCWTAIESHLSSEPSPEGISRKRDGAPQRQHLFFNEAQDELERSGTTNHAPTTVNVASDSQSYSRTKVWQRNSAGLHLVGNDERAFDGFANLQRWMTKYHSRVSPGTFTFSFPAYSLPSIPPISNLARLFGM